MKLTYKCVICNKVIENPRVSRKTCAKVACKAKYKQFSNRVYKQIKNKIGKGVVIFGEPRGSDRELTSFQSEINEILRQKAKEGKYGIA